MNKLEHYWYSILVYLSPVNLSTTLTGPKASIGDQMIIGNHNMFTCRPGVSRTCRPVNLSTRVDRSSGKYRRAGHYGYLVLVHLLTCQLVSQG